MRAQGVFIAALFCCVAAGAGRAERGGMDALGGVARQMPVLALLAMLFTMANVGLPGTGAFVGELLVLMGAVHVSIWVALLAGGTMIMGAVYMLSLYRRVLFGSVRGTVGLLRDLTVGELAVLAPLAVVTVWMGVHPGTFTRLFDPMIMQAVHGGMVNVASSSVHDTVLHLASR